jgi:hypothetical protein
LFKLRRRFRQMTDDRSLAFRYGRQCVGDEQRRLAENRRPGHPPRIKNTLGENADMSALSRRIFLALAGSAAAATFSGRFTTSADAAMGPADKFDLVIKGGRRSSIPASRCAANAISAFAGA